ncbi:MAG: amidohydrolase family protein [Pseudomonadota bacterium]
MRRFDCHAHVYESCAAIAGARYCPTSPAPLDAWLDNLKKHGFAGGVLVQVSFLGSDNSELCAALARLDTTRFAGVGVVALDVDDVELDRLVQSGIRGIRWNLVRGAPIPDVSTAVVQSLFQKLRNHNLHLEVHLEGPRLAPRLAELADQGVNVVIDHFGLPSEPTPAVDPLFKSVEALADRTNLYVKLSAHYRTPFDLAVHSRAWLDLVSDKQVVWGSDWPHTQHESVTSYSETIDAVAPVGAVSDAASAAALYGVSAD